MQLHNLQRKTPNKSEKRVGRGGKRGKTSGRGTKGQKARAGHRIRPQIREELKKLPKLRGRGTHGLRSIALKPMAVNVGVLERVFAAGETITPSALRDRNVIRGRRGGKFAVKVLGDGELTKKFTLEGCQVSESAKAKIEAAGGSINE
jgi:large subunit ribosomal protein L15